MLLLLPALAREVSIKIHDRDGTLPENLTVEISGAGTTRTYTPRDNGEDGDVVAGDHLFTAKAELPVDSGKVKVTAGAKSWTGEFLFEETSDPVLLVGLEPNGMAAASTHEVMFFPDQNSPGSNPGNNPGNNPGGPGMLPPLTGVAPPQTGMMPPPGNTGNKTTNSLLDQKPATPKGMWLGFVTLGATFASLGALVWRSQSSLAPRRLALKPGASDRLYVGKAPAGAAQVDGPGPWTATELALAAWEHATATSLRTTLVVTDPGLVMSPREELEQLFEGRGTVIWDSGTGEPTP